MKNIKTILIGLLITLFFAISVTSCNNSSGGSGSAPINFEWDYFPAEGDYELIIQRTSEQNSSDKLKINFKIASESFMSDTITVMKNEQIIYGVQHPSAGYNSYNLSLELCKENLCDFMFYYTRESDFVLKIKNRNLEYDFVSFKKDGADLPIRNNKKLYTLKGKTEEFYIDSTGSENSIWCDHTFHPGETIIIKYKPLENYNFTEKYYLVLYDDQDTHQIYKRAADNVNFLTYTFIDADIDRCFQARLIGIDEYEGSEVYRFNQELTVAAN